MATTETFASTPDVSFTSEGDTDASTNRNICGIISMLESPAVQREKHKIDDGLLATQPIEILKDVVAFVEVRTGAENRSKAIISKLKQLGAVVVDKLSDEVTHVIWKDGKRNTLQRAKKRNIPVVTVLWVESCMQNETRVSENLFAVQDNRQTGTPVHLPRLKKTKSMQPKDFDEDVASSAERGERIRKRRENKCKINSTSPSKTSAHFVAETQPLSPFFGSPFSPNLAVPDTPASLRERFNCMKRNMRELQDSESDGPESPVVIQPGTSREPLVHRKLFGAVSSPLSTPPSSPRPLSTSTQKSPFNYSKCDPIEEERDCDQEPVSSNKSKSPRSARNEKQSVAVNRTESPKLAKSQRDNGKPSQKSEKKSEDSKTETRIIAKTRKKKLYTTSDRPQQKLIVPTATSTTSGAEKVVKDISDIKVKNRPKNDNSPISELVGLPIQMEIPKRKRGKTLDSESESGHTRKRSKTSSSGEDAELNSKVTRAGKSCKNENASLNSAEQKKFSLKKPTNFTGVKEKNKSSKEIPIDVLLQDFDSEYDDSTLYLNSQAGKSKIWATTDINTQRSRLANGRVTRRKSSSLQFEETKTASTQNIETVAQSTLVSKTRRRKTMAVSSPAPESVESSENPVTSSPKVKTRRKSIATCSQSVPGDGIDSDQESGDSIKVRRKSTANIKSEQIDFVRDNSSDVSGEAVAVPVKRKTRRSSVAVFNTISEGTEIEQSKNDVRKELKKSNRPLDRDAKGISVQETPELPKSSSPSILQTPMKEVHSRSPSHPGTPSTTHTPINRRRSMRVLAISNSMQKAGTPREYGLQHVHPEDDTVEIAREKDATIANEVSIDVASNKCPADFDSTGDESLLQLAKRKRKKASNTTQLSQICGIQRPRAESTASSDSSMSHIDGVNNLSSASVFSPINSRKSIDEFRPNVFNISTKKKISKVKPSMSDIESSEEEAKLENSRGVKTKKCKSKSADLKKMEVTSGNILSDYRYSKPKTKSIVKKNSSKSSADSTCSSTSDTTDAGTKRRRKRSSGSKSSKYTNSVVMTSLHFKEQDAVRSVIKQMGSFHLIDEVDDSTTHVICGEKRRTLNVLYAIARGCWLVSQEWVFNSLESGQWIDEEPFEVHDYFPACQISRLEKATAPGLYQQDLFSRTGLIYVCEETSPPAKHLRALIQLCSGQITRCQRKADLFVGGLRSANVCVSEQWVLDSITAHRSLPVEQYRLGMNGRLVRSPSPDY